MPDIELKISKNEALVLFEFLSRFSENDTLDIEDQSEARVLWNLLGVLEKELVEPLQGDYHELIRSARNELRDEDDTNSGKDNKASSKVCGA